MILILLAFAAASVSATETNQMYVRRARMEDQAVGSSGYMYRSDSNGPTSYVHFSGSAGDLSGYGYPPIAITHSLDAIPEMYSNVQQYYPETYASDYKQDVDVRGGIAAVEAEAEKQRQAYDQDLTKSRIITLDNGSEGSEGSGENYDVSKYSGEGEKGEKGYENVDKYDEGSQGKHEKEEDKGFYDKKGGNKEGYHESSGHYGSKQEAAKGSKGESFSESSGHKKGSKTTGYHKVYHKDEYKKDHSFYDESDKRGHYDKHGNAQSEHSNENGAFAKGGHSAAGFQEDKQGKEGAYDKGHYDKNDSKFLAEEGKNAYHENHSDFGKESGTNNGESFGYKIWEVSVI